MAHFFFFKLLPPRPSFTQDMTEAERELMERHAAYWQVLLNRAPCLFLGLCSTQKVPTGLASRPLRMKQRRAPLQRMIPLLRRIAVSRTISVRWQPSPETHNQDHKD